MKQGEGSNKLIYILEIVYAILLSWGFARIAEHFNIHHFFYWLCMLVSLLTLIRFFFAPSHNVGVVVKLVKSKAEARAVVFFDIPILVLHSFVFFRMSYAMADIRYDYFFRDFSILLLMNSFWLETIRLRQRHAKVNPHDKHLFWEFNNLVFGVLIMAMSLLKVNPGIMFLFAVTNCTLDLWFCAPYYFDEV